MNMSTYRKRTQSKPTTAAGLRAEASANGNSIFRNRPVSLAGLFDRNRNCYLDVTDFSPAIMYSSPPYLITSARVNEKQQISFLKNGYSNSADSLNISKLYASYGSTSFALTLPSRFNGVCTTSMRFKYMGDSRNNLKGHSFVRHSSSFKSFNPKYESTFEYRSSSLQNLISSEQNINGQEHSGPSRRLDLEQSATLSAEVSMLKKSLPLENGDLDYKKLYEESELENERLREKLRRSDAQLKDAESMLVNVPDSQNKPTFSEIEKREKRAMERKLSEMEEELKQLQTLKAENERLKAENRALTRVVSKLTNTTK